MQEPNGIELRGILSERHKAGELQNQICPWIALAADSDPWHVEDDALDKVPLGSNGYLVGRRDLTRLVLFL